MNAGGEQRELSEAEIWRLRLKEVVVDADQYPLVFIVGSGLSWERGAPAGEGIGVWDVKTMVERGQELLLEKTGKDPATADRSLLPTGYQALMGRLGAIGSELPNLLVRRGVLAACTALEAPDVARLKRQTQRNECLKLQERSADWRLPTGIRALARYIRRIEEVRANSPLLRPPSIITTNFDGLLEIALRREGIPFETQAVIVDTQLQNVSHAVTVWHVHGSWLGQITMHTQEALEADCPLISQSLKRRFDGAHVVALGYGAWNDAVFSAVSEVFRGSFERAPEVTWGFHETDAAEIYARYPHVFESFKGRMAGQVCFAKGVDVHRDLAAVVELEAEAGRSTRRERGAGGANGQEAEPPKSDSDPQSAKPGGSGWPPNWAVEELRRATPKEARRALSKLLQSDGGLPDICRVVAQLCEVLQGLQGEARLGFVRPAWLVVSSLAREIVQRAASGTSAELGGATRSVTGAQSERLALAEPRSVGRLDGVPGGGIKPAPLGDGSDAEELSRGGELRVRTELFAEIVMALRQARDLSLGPTNASTPEQGTRGSAAIPRRESELRGSDQCYDETTEARLEVGQGDDDLVAQLEQLFWSKFFPSHQVSEFERQRLDGRAEARWDCRHQPFALTNADGPSCFDSVAVRAAFPWLALVPRTCANTERTWGFSEFRLAEHICRFVESARNVTDAH